MLTMFYGLCDLLFGPDISVNFPSTFLFDFGRLKQLQAEIQRIINEEICWNVFLNHVNDKIWNSRSRDELRASFHDRFRPLLDDDKTASSTWECRVPNVAHLAVEIARLVHAINIGQDANIPDRLLHVIEKEVESSLMDESPQVHHIRAEIREKFWEPTVNFANRYVRMSPLTICESQRSSLLTPASSLYSLAVELQSLAMRFAHIGVLHWRVWASLLYEREESLLAAFETR